MYLQFVYGTIEKLLRDIGKKHGDSDARIVIYIFF